MKRVWRQLILLCVVVVMFGRENNAESAENFAAPVPEVFAPGVISNAAHDSAPAFTPDGNTVYFSRSNTKLSIILVSHLVQGQWTTPVPAPFSGVWNDMEPSISPDGKFLIFVSSRPTTAGGKPIDGHFNKSTQAGQGGNLWRAERTATGWSEPKRLPDAVNRSTSIFAPSVVGDGSVYFMDSNQETGRFQIYRSQWRNGEYQAPATVGFSDGSSTDVDPAVAPDESFVVFGSGRPPAGKPGPGMDLFIAFRQNGVWGKPIHLGNVINSPTSDAEARLSPDQKTLYFSSERIVPFEQPLSASQAKEFVNDMSWNNGQYNIWRVPLEPILSRFKDSGSQLASSGLERRSRHSVLAVTHSM
jgi:WD40-like Beta Propeller Repeat